MKNIKKPILFALMASLNWGCEKEEALKCEKINKEAEIGKVFCIRAKPVVLAHAGLRGTYCEVMSPDSLGTCGDFKYGFSHRPDIIRMKKGIFLYGYDERTIKLQTGVEYNLKVKITEKFISGIFEEAGPSQKLNHATIEGVDVCAN